MAFSFKSIASWALLLLLLMQFIPLNRTNPAPVSSMQAPNVINNALKKSCYDCHSNETRWPAIAWIAPTSWLASGIVTSGRNALNFSAWNNNKKREIREVIVGRAAHQGLYFLWKPDAQLTVTETNALLKWLE